MAHLPVPEVRFALAPRGDGEEHRPACRVECVPHELVVVAWLLRGIVHPAEVILNVVDAPRRVVKRVLLLVASRAWSVLARLIAGTRVHAKFEPKRVDVVAQSLHAARKLVREREDVARQIIACFHPAVV